MNPGEGRLRDPRSFVEEHDDEDVSCGAVDRASSLAEFLSLCARSLTADPGQRHEQYADEFCRARDVFIRAGLEALTVQPLQSGGDWLQIGIRPREDRGPREELHRQVADLARGLLSDSTVHDFFFMNKPPGMRLRFRTAEGGGPADVAEALYAEATRWRARGLIDHVEPGVYEPESQLFGGPRSMSFVHALFTVDSLLWLDYYSCNAGDGEGATPAWLMSLAVLQSVFAGLDITGWEDIGVWDGIREIGGRRLGVSLPVYADLADELRGVWSRGDQIVEGLDPAAKEIVSRYDDALLTGAARWRSGYFCQPQASIGPRAAAAFFVMFHWNRARLSPTEQALVAESLAERIPVDVRG